MKLLKWFYPGMRIKRWIALAMVGVIMLSMGFVIIISEEHGNASLGTSIIIIIGLLALITGVKRVINSLIIIFLPKSEKDLVDIVYKQRQLEKGPRIIAIGGGSGLTTILHGLKEHTNNITAVVTVADEGRLLSSIQERFETQDPTVVRESLIALADSEPIVSELFHYRFKKGTELWGYNFGDLFLNAMAEITGDFDRAVKESSRVLAVRGQVLLSTLEKISVIAQHEDKSETIGRENILNSISPIKKIYLRPPTARLTQEAVNAISRADVLVICPGALYTETMPGLLVNGMKEAIANSKAIKVYIVNLMTKSTETDNYKASDHLKAIAEHTGTNLIGNCIVNNNQFPVEKLKEYEQEGALPVAVDKDGLANIGCRIIEDHIIDKTANQIRHDSSKIGGIIMDLINDSKRTRAHAK